MRDSLKVLHFLSCICNSFLYPINKNITMYFKIFSWAVVNFWSKSARQIMICSIFIWTPEKVNQPWGAFIAILWLFTGFIHPNIWTKSLGIFAFWVYIWDLTFWFAECKGSFFFLFIFQLITWQLWKYCTHHTFSHNSGCSTLLKNCPRTLGA